MSDRHGINRKEKAKREKRERLSKLKNGDKNYDTPCICCDAVPTVYPVDLCGPCCFGEAETAGGNW